MPDTTPVPEPDVIPNVPTTPGAPGPDAPPEVGGDDPRDVEVDLDEQARRDADRDRELRERYGDQEY